MATLSALDWTVVVLYFVLVFGVAWWAYRTGIGSAAGATSAGYFLAGRNIGWFVVGASLFASNIGSEHLTGLSGAGAASGVAVAQFEILASLILLLLGWVFVPFYIRSGVFTMPEFLERRYSPASRWYLSLVSIIAYVLTKISVTIYAGGIVFETLMGIGFWTGAFIVVVATGIYTVAGGLRAVVYTDLLQVIVLFAGHFLLLAIGLQAIGGWGELRASVQSSYYDMWLPSDHPSFPWTGILFGAPILAIWYWCTDQFIVQRTLAARDRANARRGTIFAGYLKLLPLFLFVVPGIIAHALAERGELQLDRADAALPTLIGTLMPTGVRGLLVAALLAALMSSLSSVFNSCSTLITNDIYKPLHPKATERQLVWVGQIATGGLVVLGLLWVPFMGIISGRLYEYLQSVQAYISPPIAAVFLFGILWPRINGTGAITALLTGLVLGAARLFLELANGSDRDGLPDGSIWATMAEINFLHFAVLLFVVCSAVLIVVSLMTKTPSRTRIAGLTYATVDQEHERGAGLTPEMADSPAERRTDAVLSLVLIGLVGVIWLYFTG